MCCGSASAGRAGRALRTSGDYVTAEPLTPTEDGSTPDSATHRVLTGDVTHFFASYDAAYAWQANNGGMLHTV